MTNSAESDLEAVIWAAMTAHKVTTPEPLEFIETLKAAAMDYAAGDSDALTETRRTILHEATGGATLSTGPSVPYPGQGLFKLRPQAVDNSGASR